ncbi:MAG: 30S ribosomal protein S4 [Bacteroidetes bacterium 4572_112]|nr:MAG: 30S ribosomal protein S4 [Bacteroidetes bacterium 4572_112]
MNYNGPKVRLSRKLGIQMTPKAGKVMQKKNYPPGAHGNGRRRGKISDYGKQLMEKQRLRLQYNISENHMRKAYKDATSMTGNTGELLVQVLESRLDAFVYRAGFAPTIYAARQFVSHSHFLVNGKKMNIPSYKVKLSDVISVKEKSRTKLIFQDAMRNASSPEYIELSKTDFSAKLAYIPARSEVPVECEVPLVVEYYSR